MLLQDQIGIPACFSAEDSSVTKSSQSVFMSVYMTKIGDQCSLITVTWCKNLMLHGLSVSIDGQETEDASRSESSYPPLNTCKVELKPWNFWRKQGSKSFLVDGKSLGLFWDLKNAKFHGETEPISEYYVAVVFGDEVVLVLGDMKKNAYRKTGCRPSLIDPILISRKEHVFGKKKFQTRVKFNEKGKFHDICIECKNRNIGNTVDDQEMEIRIDGDLMIHVKHLQWKFRGNELIHLNKIKIEVYWDVHDWLFSPGLRNALFVIKPTSSLATFPSPLSQSPAAVCGSVEGLYPGLSCMFCLFLYAWKIE
ncbi:uncharacterized protein [Rutidosis leptorrhynchoides]|uniref:uncharacterized protein n=1 Tax=Rutidosis leptorrhynchoides TaxID=125765 RepID=UPI003A995F12